MRREGANPDVIVAGLAARQHGAVSFEQLLGAGISSSGVCRRMRAGRLHRIHRGVYAVGHPGLSDEGRWMAAVLALGKGAVLSHRSAAELWTLLPARGGLVDVTVPSASGRARRADLRLHRSPLLQAADTTRHRRIAVTTPVRTIIDLRRVAGPEEARKAIRQAEFLDLDLAGIGSDHTNSELERLFLALCRRHRFPLPERNQRIGPYRVDFLWRSRRLVVETDGYAAHRGRQAFEDDRRRELYLHARGFRLRRFTYAQVTGEPAAVGASVRAELG